MSRVDDRRSIRSFRKSSNTWAVALCALDFSVSAAALVAVIVLPGMFEKLIASLLLGLQIARLFVLGHDACHQSLFESRRLNRWVGRLLFLPSLTPYSAWEIGHNLGHHVYTNLRGMDHVWTPLSKAEFDALPGWRKLLQRFYRSGFGYGAYYLVELWWRELFFVPATKIPARRGEVLADSVLVTGVLLGWIVLLLVAARATHQQAVVLVMTGFVVPFLIWNWLMGAVIYFHHTNPQLAWYDDIDQWQAARDTGCNTVHVQCRGKLGRLLNNIMEHPAHHLDVRIPLYKLEAANRTLDVTSHIAQTVSPRSLYACIRSCKLYDYQAHHWTDFAGRQTGPTLGRGDDESVTSARPRPSVEPARPLGSKHSSTYLARPLRRLFRGKVKKAKLMPVAEAEAWKCQLREFCRCEYGIEFDPLQSDPRVVPPASVVNRVQGGSKSDQATFFGTGYRETLRYLTELRDFGFDITRMERMLDMGFGTGRILLHFLPFELERFGCDVNPVAYEWTTKTLGEYARLNLSCLEPRFEYPDEFFDLIIATSVFTHTPYATQPAWIDEIGRVLKPGGACIVTVQDPSKMPASARKRGWQETAVERGIHMNTYLTEYKIAELWGTSLEFLCLRTYPGSQSHVIARRPRGCALRSLRSEDYEASLPKPETVAPLR